MDKLDLKKIDVLELNKDELKALHAGIAPLIAGIGFFGLSTGASGLVWVVLTFVNKALEKPA